MTPDRHARIKELFLAALELPAGERDAWLQRTCAEDPSLVREVQLLLAQQSAELLSATRHSAPSQPPQRHAASVEAASSTPTREAPIPAALSSLLTEEAVEERPPGTLIAGRYRIVSRLGAGGMGIVYRADDLTLRQAVAIKFLPSGMASNPAWLGRFRNEARLARTVTHPNVCRVHDVGEADGHWFITMEFVAGENLAGLLRRIGQLSAEKALDIARQICAGLAAAHRAGILHRDLKPANIMIDEEGNARITDFGIAGIPGRIAPRDLRAGTPAFMAPEQINGRGVTLKSDIYTLGLVLYELFSGRPAFHASSVEEYAQLHETSLPCPLSEMVKDLPDGIEQIVTQCLQKDPELRPGSALHVAAALPGTDVLRLALTSGLTPSPDLIAAAPVERTEPGNRLRLAAIGTVFLAAVVLLRTVYPGPWDDLGQRPPAALVERARRILEVAGASIPRASEAYGYCATQDAWWPMVRAFADYEVARQLRPASSAGPCFFYRQSDRPLVPANMENVFWHAGSVTAWDPPLSGANSRAVLFDHTGRLILLGAASMGAGPRQSAQPMDLLRQTWHELSEASGIGFDVPALPMTSDSRRAEPGTCFVADESYGAPTARPSQTVAGCTSTGGSLFFAAGLRTDGRVPSADQGTMITAWPRWVVTTAQRALFLLLLVVAVPMGIRRLREGRVDTQGAVRLAGVVVLVNLAATVLRIGSAATFTEALSRTSIAVVRGVGIAALLGVFYLAVDAYARRHWPHLLVTWNRLLCFRFRDMDVRFHVLVGACVGCWWGFAVAAERALVVASGLEPRATFASERFAEKLQGFASVVASYLVSIEQSILFALLFLLLLVVLRTWTGRPLWAGIACAILLAPIVVPRGAHAYTSWLAIGLGGAAVSVWLMVRYGLLALVVAIFVSAAVCTTPISVQSGAWTMNISAWVLVMTVGLIAYGGWRSSAGNWNPVPTTTGA